MRAKEIERHLAQAEYFKNLLAAQPDHWRAVNGCWAKWIAHHQAEAETKLIDGLLRHSRRVRRGGDTYVRKGTGSGRWRGKGSRLREEGRE